MFVESGHDIRRGNSSYKSSSIMDASLKANHSSTRGMVLPFEPHSITFNEITYSVDMPEVNNCTNFQKGNILFK